MTTFYNYFDKLNVVHMYSGRWLLSNPTISIATKTIFTVFHGNGDKRYIVQIYSREEGVLSLKIGDTLTNTFERASFLIDGRPINKSDFINRNVEIITEILTSMSNQRTVILHPGTSLFFYLSTVLASFKAYMSDDTDKLAFIDSLSIGDLVIYQGKRGEYKGEDDEGRTSSKTVIKGF